MLKEYHLSEYSFHADVKNMQHHFKTHIDSSMVQNKHTIGSGDVGLDIGTQTIAISSQADVKLFELARKSDLENHWRTKPQQCF